MSNHPLRVLVLADSRSFHVERYVVELKRQGCDVLLASLEDGSISHHQLRKGKPRNRLSYLLASSEIRELIVGQFHPDVVNAHYAVGYGASAAIATRGLSVPVVLQLWGSDILVLPVLSFIRRLKAIIALKSADVILGDSRYLVRAARKLHNFPHGEIIPWGIEQKYLELFNPERIWQKPLLIISPRAHEPIYNHEFLLESLRPLLERNEVSWSLPDWGSGIDNFKQVAGGLIGKSVFLYSRKLREDLMPFFARHDIYLSAASSDSSPASLIEAMGLGLLPICADIPGVSDWLTSENGFLFSGTDTTQLRAIVEGMLKRPADYASIITRNHDRVEEKAIFENNIAQTIELMHEALSHAGKNR